MCGISGIVYKNGQSIQQTVIQKMNDRISHRGPDGAGFYFYENIAFGHRRLAIIDLSDEGKQPMAYDKENLIITFNGEIYNYKELKEELLQQGYVFNNQTDTEVILAAYQAWGEKCVERFNGMWSFAVLDKKNNTIF